MPKNGFEAKGDPTVPDPCAECGKVHYKIWGSGNGYRTCAAHRRKVRDENGMKIPCTRSPVQGTTVCPLHGGSVTKTREKGAEKIAMREINKRATAALVSVGISPPPGLDPIQELLTELVRSQVAVNWLGARVAELVTPELDGDIELRDVKTIDAEGNLEHYQPRAMLYGPNRQGDLKVHPLWTAWNEERDRHAKLAAAAVKAGISERMVRIAEAQSDIMVELIRRMFDKLQLPATLRELGIQFLAEEFDAIDASAVPLGLSLPGE